MATYTPDAACFDAANTAANGRLNRNTINEAFQKIVDYRDQLRAAGNIDGMADKLKSYAEREAERTKVAAALQKRHAALNILVRERMDAHIQSLIKQGMKPYKAIRATLEGTEKGVVGGRDSVAALNLAYESRYIGGLLGELQANRPHLVHMLDDQKFNDDVMREMVELKKDGKPGITKNADAQYAAKVFASYAELSRTDLNKLGASIGKLDGWAGAQSHDDIRMIAAGKEAWIDFTIGHLDLARTFPDVTKPEDLEDAMSGIYDTIITGFDNRVSPREKGERVNPANLAKTLGKSRVLHFKNADAAIAYRDKFGFGNTISGIVAHLRRAATMAAAMERLGPNPEMMFNSLIEHQKRRIKTSKTLSPAEKNKQINDLDAQSLKHALDIAVGLAHHPGNVTAARIGSDIRGATSMAKLGGALFASTVDPAIAGIAAQFRGSGFARGLAAQLNGIIRGRPKGEQAEISYILGEGYDGLIGNLIHPAVSTDAPVGKLARLQEKYFKWNGLTPWTDLNRSVTARVVAAEMGMHSKKEWSQLYPNYRHVLSLHGIGEAQWNAIRRAGVRLANGKEYITPDLMRDLDDSVIEPLVADRVARARKASKLDEAKSEETRSKREANFQERKVKIIEDGRRDLEMKIRAFVADETAYGIIEVDRATRRVMTQGTRPGTFAGEAIRYIGLFKGFPMAFSRRVGGRALFGQRPDASKLEKGFHIGTILATMTVAGYMAMTLKDMAKGYWPPRDPTDPATWAAAFVQGGAAGIYGDYLFSQRNRFGGTLLQTTAGPTIGSAFEAGEIVLDTVHSGVGAALGEPEKFPGARAVSWIGSNTPFVNLFYVRPAVDYLFLNSMREAASPGYLRRQATRRKTEYKQTKPKFLPKSLEPFN